MKVQLNDRESSIISYQQPEESFRQIYDLAANPDNIDKLREMSKRNPLFAAIVKALDSHQLPPFETIARYTSPSGAFVTEEETGLHYTASSLDRITSPGPR